MHRTTAQLRSDAWDAEILGYYARAAELYQAAIDVYPNGTGALRARDLEGLAQRRDHCRSVVCEIGEAA